MSALTHSRRLWPALFAALALLLAPAGAQGAFGLGSPDVYFANADGTPANLAGAHPDSLSTQIVFNSLIAGGLESPDGMPKDIDVAQPLGLAGIPKAIARCSGADFADVDKSATPVPRPRCSDDTVIGYAQVAGSFRPITPGSATPDAVPLYNLEPAPGTVAKFGFNVLGVPITIEARLSQTPPYRVIAQVHRTAQPVLLFNTGLVLWGDPAAAVHDPYRGSCLNGLDLEGKPQSQGICPVSEGAPKLAFLTSPRACEGPLATDFTANSWEAPGVFDQTSATTHDDQEPPNPLGFEGCEDLGYAPHSTLAATTRGGETASGLNFDLEVADPGVADPAQRAQSDTKELEITLPEGVTVNPSAATGLAGCTLAQLDSEKLTSAPGEGCPQAAKIGDVAIASPLVEELLEGEIFIAAPDDPEAAGHENPFDSFLALYMVARNQQLGVIVKQAGEVSIDPLTGQLSTRFADIPQLPFSHIQASFRQGPRAPLVTPGGCGTFEAEIKQTPWAAPGSPLTDTAAMQIVSGPGGGPCQGPQGPLTPGFSAGSADNRAGAYSPLSLRITRTDGQAEFTRISAILPPGLSGKLAGVGRCPEAQIAAAAAKSGRAELAAPSCPATSQVGTVAAGSGVGTSLTYATGKVYLAGPYAGAPFSMAIIAPAVSGPFDLGTVVVREALRIDPTTAQVTADGGSSPPLPRILKGIPLRLRDLRVNIDRPGFALNPTSCQPGAIVAGIAGSGPAIGLGLETLAQIAARYQARECGALPYKPKLSFRLKGATKRTGHPALRVQLDTRPGDANSARVATILPRSQFIDPERVANPCTRPRFAAGTCPKASILGRARAFSPLLDNPLEGNVYFRSNGGERELPDVVADLKGEVNFTLVGFVDAVVHKGSEVSRIRTIFQTPPDVPVAKFVLRLKGGKQGLLQNSANLCKAPQPVIAKLKAHNSRRLERRQAIKVSCKKSKRQTKRHQGPKSRTR
jgi:hypothetical protein